MLARRLHHEASDSVPLKYLSGPFPTSSNSRNKSPVKSMSSSRKTVVPSKLVLKLTFLELTCVVDPEFIAAKRCPRRDEENKYCR